MTQKSWKTKWLGTVAALLVGASVSAAKAEDLVVYTALEDEQLAEYAAAFNAVHPDITIQWVRDSTGPITARLLAEKDNRQADVIWGLAATSLLLFKGEGMLEAYAPAGLETMKPNFRDTDEVPSWIGMDAWASAICYNEAEGALRAVPAPASWEDLLKPIYKNQIVMPNPNSSGTGYLTVAAWIQLWGEEKAWAYMDKLHNNISTYLHSGSKPCVKAAEGEYTMGISFAYRGVKEMNKGAPLQVILPTEGIGWDMEAAAILAGTDNPDAAKKLMDFAASMEANELYNASYSVVAQPIETKVIPNYPENEEALMIANDFAWSAANRERILAEWQTRYGSKDAPK